MKWHCGEIRGAFFVIGKGEAALYTTAGMFYANFRPVINLHENERKKFRRKKMDEEKSFLTLQKKRSKIFLKSYFIFKFKGGLQWQVLSMAARLIRGR